MTMMELGPTVPLPGLAGATAMLGAAVAAAEESAGENVPLPTFHRGQPLRGRPLRGWLSQERKR